jgi:hypothetical protein
VTDFSIVIEIGQVGVMADGRRLLQSVNI